MEQRPFSYHKQAIRSPKPEEKFFFEEQNGTEKSNSIFLLRNSLQVILNTVVKTGRLEREGFVQNIVTREAGSHPEKQTAKLFQVDGSGFVGQKGNGQHEQTLSRKEGVQHRKSEAGAADGNAERQGGNHDKLHHFPAGLSGFLDIEGKQLGEGKANDEGNNIAECDRLVVPHVFSEKASCNDLHRRPGTCHEKIGNQITFVK